MIYDRIASTCRACFRRAINFGSQRHSLREIFIRQEPALTTFWRPLSQSRAIDELSVRLSWMKMIYGTIRHKAERSARVFFGRVLACSNGKMICWCCCLYGASPALRPVLIYTFHHFLLINWIIIFVRALRWGKKAKNVVVQGMSNLNFDTQVSCVCLRNKVVIGMFLACGVM